VLKLLWSELGTVRMATASSNKVVMRHGYLEVEGGCIMEPLLAGRGGMEKRRHGNVSLH
jgi:hypothetical protein